MHRVLFVHIKMSAKDNLQSNLLVLDDQKEVLTPCFMAHSLKLTFRKKSFNFKHATCTHNAKCANSDQTDYWGNEMKLKKKRFNLDRDIAPSSIVFSHLIFVLFTFLFVCSLFLQLVCIHSNQFVSVSEIWNVCAFIIGKLDDCKLPKAQNKLPFQNEQQTLSLEAKEYFWIF